MTDIPEKYLNTNVRAMLSGGNVETEPEPEPEYVLCLDKLFSCFKKKYRVKLKIIKEEP
jgi:hypothetical protein|tara:strand:+ start:1291 stop:1467 length:177 start_codon:yes stop_codon:yes gene_type:complete